MYSTDTDKLKTGDILYTLYHGHYIATHSNNNLYRSISYYDNGLFRFILDMKELHDLYNNLTLSIGSIKKIILDRVNYLNTIEELEYAKLSKACYLKYFESLRELQYRDKLIESFICNSSPIVPYAGIIKKSGTEIATDNENKSNPEFKETDDMFERMSNIFILISSYLNKDEDKQDYAYLETMVMSFGLKLFDHVDLFISDIPDNNINYDGITSIVQNLAKSNEHTDIPKLYYILSYLQYSISANNNYEKVNEFLVTSISSYSAPVADMVKYIINNSNDVTLSAVSESMMKLDKEYQETISQKIDESAITIDELNDIQSNRYELDKITSFIYNSRRFTYNAYTNNMFLNNNKCDVVRGYSFLKNDLMVCEINDKYLCCPVIDIADNYKLKLILMDRDGIIQLVTDIDSAK